jgi:tetratricopeptide (TPR) repeat protein
MNVITIAISLLALLVSIASVGISVWISNRDSNRTLRAQMNALLPQIAESNARELVNPSLAMQAVSLIKQKPELMNANDYLETADLLFYVADWETACEYYETAVTKSAGESDFFKIMCRRGYAVSLFRQHDYEKGRKMYREALSIVSHNTDLHRALNAYTHLMWYNNESTHALGGTSSAEDHYQETKRMYEKVMDPTERQRGLHALEMSRQRFLGPPQEPEE